MPFFAIDETTADGISDLVSVPFPYLEQAHVHVSLDGVQEPDNELTWTGPSTIQLDHVPVAGVVIRVFRSTPIDEPLVVFQPGVFSADSLNDSVLAQLYAAQEVHDKANEGVTLDTVDGTLDAHSRRIKNVGAPTADTDAATKKYVDDTALAGVGDGSLTTSKLADGAVTTAKLADGATTNAKLADMASGTVKMRASAGAGDPEDVSAEIARGALKGARANCVIMARDTDSENDPSQVPAAWKVYKADGTLLDTAGTTTQGLQEAINEMAEFGHDLLVYGGPVKPMYFGVPYGGALGNNPFTTQATLTVVSVAHTSHGLNTGDKVLFFGLDGDVNGIPAAEFGVELEITVVDLNSYTVVPGSAATASGADGGATVRFQHAGQDPSIISCTSGIVWPPLQKGSIRFQSVSVNIGGSVSVGMTFDSCMALDFEWRGGQIVCGANTDIGVLFKPTKELPFDSAGPVITTSRFLLPSIVMLKATGICVRLDPDEAPIGDGNFFECIEPNAGQYGVQLLADATNGVFNNHFKITECHSQSAVGLAVGVNAIGATNIYNNVFYAMVDVDVGAAGVDIWGINNVLDIIVSGTEGPATTGVSLGSSASGNVLRLGGVAAGTAKVIDSSTDKSNRIDGREIAASVHRNGTDQTGVVTATWTKIALTTEIFDAGGAFDSVTNNRWTPGRPGYAMITASLGWVGTVDATLGGIAIYKNGVLHKAHYQYASSAGGSQGPNIAAIVKVDNETDYFEIFARQDTGVNQDIAGAADTTWAMFKLL